ncbi:hypothetical protein BDZ97DRAFT_2054202 [Flammula alnicola]|nr:hypothetical protein BDZ97DRAFT_2054202 [Flammula alnicola]
MKTPAKKDIQHDMHHCDHSAQHHSTAARKIVLANGVFNVLLALSIMFFPILFYDGPLASTISKVTGLHTPSWSKDPTSAYGVAALIMGCAFSGLTAGQSKSNDAYRTVAALNGAFAFTGFIVCFFSAHKFGSSFLLLASLQDVVWYASIVHAGGFGFMDSLGLSTRGLYALEECLAHDITKREDQGSEEIVEKRGEISSMGSGAHL